MGSGKFSHGPILDNGAEEALTMPTAQEAKLPRDFFSDAESVYRDAEKGVLIFGKTQWSEAADASGSGPQP